MLPFKIPFFIGYNNSHIVCLFPLQFLNCFAAIYSHIISIFVGLWLFFKKKKGNPFILINFLKRFWEGVKVNVVLSLPSLPGSTIFCLSALTSQNIIDLCSPYFPSWNTLCFSSRTSFFSSFSSLGQFLCSSIESLIIFLHLDFKCYVPPGSVCGLFSLSLLSSQATLYFPLFQRPFIHWWFPNLYI